MQSLLDKHLIPVSARRLGLRLEDIEKRHYLAESVLDSRRVFDKSLEECSLVAMDTNTGQVVGCQINYFLDKKEYEKEFIQINKTIMADKSYEESVRRYCQHRLAVSQDMFNVYDKLGVERLLYLETTCILPNYRQKYGLKEKLIIASLNLTDEAVLTEGQWSIESYMQRKEKNVMGEIFPSGFVMYRRYLSYDNYVIPVLYLPPRTKKAKL